MLRFIVLLLPFVALVSGQEKVWAELGDTISIKCPVEAKENIFGCDWVSPNGTEVDIRKIDLEFKSRDERLSGQFNAEQCSVTIPATEERDFGQWICKIYHGLSGEVEEGKTQLGMINMPEGVVLIVEETNNTEEGLHKSRCVVAADAAPEPQFSWFIDEELLNENSVEKYIVKEASDDDEIIRLLSFLPKPEHSNKTLKCLINFDGLSETLEQSVPLEFTQDELETIEIENESAHHNTSDVSTIVVVCVASILAVGLAVFLFFKCVARRNSKAAAGGNDKDPEAQKETETEEATDKVDMNEECTEKTDQTKEERDSLNEMTKGSSFSERFATFFRLNKSYIDSKAAADETTEDAADQKNVPEVVTSTNGDTNKATDAGDNDEEEQPMVVDGEAEKAEEKKRPNRLMNFFSKMLKPRDVVADKKGEEPVKMTDCKTDDEDNCTEEKLELEPEDKPEAQLDQPDTEEKEPTPFNTSL